MKNRIGMLLAGLCLGVLTACGGVVPADAPTPGEPAQKDPRTGALYCEICPAVAGGVQAMSRKPVTDEKTGLIYCPPCDGGGWCGDGLCDYPETASTCPSDCATGPTCGNRICEDNEVFTCPQDCGDCGDGVCSAGDGENNSNCPSDCGPVCGDGFCGSGEASTNCPLDCGTVCGDGVCNGGESSASCSADCGSGGWCGDGICEYPETRYNCRADCYITTCYIDPCPIQ